MAGEIMGVNMPTKKISINHLVPPELKPLLPSEKQLLECVVYGEVCQPNSKGLDCLKDITSINTIRSELINWLCIDSRLKELIHHRGIRIKNTHITNQLDLENCHLAFPLRLTSCNIHETMQFSGAHVVVLDLSGSEIQALHARFLRSEYTLYLNDGFHSKGEVILTGAKIEGSLECGGAHLENPEKLALDGETISVRGSIFFDNGFLAQGEITLTGAEIGESLDCKQGTFKNQGGFALRANNISTGGSVYLINGFLSQGIITLSGSRVGNLVCDGGIFENPQGMALNCDTLDARGSVLLRNKFTAKGTVHLYGAKIGSDFDCSSGQFECQNGQALNANSTIIVGAARFSAQFHSIGEVLLVGAKIGNRLTCAGGHFENTAGIALAFDNATIHGPVALENILSEGIIRLNGAQIDGELDCSRSTFIQDKKTGICFSAAQVRVQGDCKWNGFVKKINGIVIFSNAKVDCLIDDESGWPDRGNLIIDGFEYSVLPYNKLANSKDRLRWLRLQPSEIHGTQPYEQLTKVFNKMGLKNDARQIQIARQEFISTRTKGLNKFWMKFLGLTIDFGYSPQKVFVWILPILIIGTLLFMIANNNGMMSPVLEEISSHSAGRPSYIPYPIFNPFLYALDVFLPIVDLHQESYWIPNTTLPNGQLLMYFMMGYILTGWLLTTLGIAAVTGLIKND